MAIWLLAVPLLSAPGVLRTVDLGDRVTEVWYHSAVLERELPLTVVMPAAVVGEVPVLVFLHGNGRDHRSLVDCPATRAALLSRPFATILPNGLRGWYVDSPVEPKLAYQRALGEAIAVAESLFPLSRDPAARAIGGWSMGGYGAAWYAVTHPGEFGVLGTLLGCLDFPNADLPSGQNHQVPAHFGPAEGWPRLNPLPRVEALRGMKLTALPSAQGFERTMNEHWRQRLAALDLPQDYRVVDGGHSWEVVERELPGLLTWFEQALCPRR